MLLDGDGASLLKTLQPLVDLSSQGSITIKVFSSVKKALTATPNTASNTDVTTTTTSTTY